MATITIDNWMDEVVPAAQLCPNPIIRKDILNACREFCKRTELWTVDLTAIDIVTDQAEYPLIYATADIAGANRAKILGARDPLDAVAEEALEEDTRESGEYWREKTEAPLEIKRYYVTPDYNLRLVYIPDAGLTAGLNVNAFVMPLETATEVPLFLYTEYKEVIAMGAKGRLKLRPDMPWTDIQTGAGYMDIFDQGVFIGRQKKFTGFMKTKTRDTVRTHYQDF